MKEIGKSTQKVLEMSTRYQSSSCDEVGQRSDGQVTPFSKVMIFHGEVDTDVALLRASDKSFAYLDLAPSTLVRVLERM